MQEENVSVVDTVCESLHLSPVSKLIKLNKAQRQSSLKTKTDKIATAIKRQLESSFDESVNLDKNKQVETTSNMLSVEYENLIEKLKEKCLQAKKKT